MLADIEFAHELLQHDAVGIPMRFQNMRVGCAQDNIDHIRVFLMTAGSACNTFSMPLLGESKPKVSSTFLPSTPNLSL
jgi:hypothetical protein